MLSSTGAEDTSTQTFSDRFLLEFGQLPTPARGPAGSVCVNRRLGLFQLPTPARGPAPRPVFTLQSSRRRMSVNRVLLVGPPSMTA